MNPKCKQAINAARIAAGGRPLTAAQADKIESMITGKARFLAQTDPNWRGYSSDQRTLLAAQAASADLAAQASRKIENAQKQALASARLEAELAQYQSTNGANRPKALREHLARTDGQVSAIKNDYSRSLMDLVSAIKDVEGVSLKGRAMAFLFDVENPQMTRDLATEVFAQGNGGTGNALAVAGAKAWLAVVEKMRQRFNAAGGDIGKLLYGYLPQAHDQAKVLAAGVDAWVSKTFPLLDKNKYVLEDGSRMPDTQIADMLRGAWNTISSAGANKSEPGSARGTGARSNRGSESREIHFKDGEAYIQYLSEFGSGSMYDAMTGHIGGIAKDIALVERYGPNPDAQMRMQFDLAKRDYSPSTFVGQVKDSLVGAEAQWRVLSGQAGQAQYARVAQIGNTVRNIQVFSKLQQTVISALTDIPNYFVATGFNKLSYWDALTNVPKVLTKEHQDFLHAHLGMAETMLASMNRYATENVTQNWSGRLANSTMKVGIVNAWTNAFREAFSLTMMQSFGRMHAKEWAALDEFDRRVLLEQRGITEDDWNVIRSAVPESFNGRQVMTPESIYATGHERAQDVATKFLGIILDESKIAVPDPDLATRAAVTAGGSQRGTFGGETARMIGQFKSFPIAMITRHVRRMVDTPQGLQGAPILANRAAYASAMLISTTIMGGIVFQIKQILSGKDPVSANPTDSTGQKFWVRALAQGGGLGFLGDLLLNDPTESFGDAASNTVGNLAGPAIGDVTQLFVKLGLENAYQAAHGDDTHIGAETFKFARQHTPFVNLWYAKAALDHMGLFALQENLSPGYLSRIQSKARKDWGQDYFFDPQSGDIRAPDFGAIAGQ